MKENEKALMILMEHHSAMKMTCLSQKSDHLALSFVLGTWDIKGQKLGCLVGATDVKGEPDKEDGIHGASDLDLDRY